MNDHGTLPADPPPASRLPPPGAGWLLAAIAAVATGLRVYQLGRLSFWYDEVVTMRLARAGSPGALIERLFAIDATRAPLHPLLLAIWIQAFGPSEAAARGLSVLCGVATVLLIFGIARTAFDTPTGLWAAWLAALSPALIVYAREARMYAWLVLVTCLSWWLLLMLRRFPESGKWQVASGKSAPVAGLPTPAVNIFGVGKRLLN
jgi:mannosyltransferase